MRKFITAKNMYLFTGGFLKITSVALKIVTFFLFSDAVSKFNDKNQPKNPVIMRDLILYASAWMLGQIADHGGTILVNKGAHIDAERSSAVIMEKMMSLPMTFHDKHSINQKINYLNESHDASIATINGIFGLTANLVELSSIASIISIKIGWIFGVSALMVVPAYTWLLMLVNNKWIVKLEQERSQADSETVNKLLDAFISIITVFSFQGEKNALSRYNTAHQDYIRKLAKLNIRNNFINVMRDLVISLFLAMTTIYTGAEVLNNRSGFSLSDFTAINGFFLLFVLPLRDLNRPLQNLLVGLHKRKKLKTIFIETNTADEDFFLSPQLDNFHREKPLIEFRQVDFQYSSNSKKILKGASFSIEENSVVAIVGMSGQGKSTIAKLIMGLYEAKNNVGDSGVYFRNTPISQIDKGELRDKIAIVLQDTYIFRDNFNFNLLYGCFNKCSSDVQKLASTKIENPRDACSPKTPLLTKKEDFIQQHSGFNSDEFKNIIDTSGLREIYENKKDMDKLFGLSGGEAQRFGIARAILKDNAMLYILDEPTSNLDGITEKGIVETFNDLLKSSRSQHPKSLLVITHRLDTVKNADKLYLLKNGALEQKNYQDLLSIFSSASFGIHNHQTSNKEQNHTPDHSSKKLRDTASYKC